MAHETSGSLAHSRASRRMTTEQRGFSLLELLVVIGIITMLCGLLMPIFAKAREMSRRTRCLSNLRQIGSALTMYADDYDGFIYPAVYNEGWKCPMGRYPPGSAWPFAIGAYARDIGVFRCPNDDLFPEDMRFAWPGPLEPRDPSKVRVSYIYAGLNIWAGPGKPWLTELWPWYLRRIGEVSSGEDSNSFSSDKKWVVRDKDWLGPRGGWVTVHDQSATKDDPFACGSNVLLLDGSARWHPYWDD